MSIVENALRDELKSAIQISKDYVTKIKESYTDTKSDYYYKKLKKNNKKVANLVINLDKLQKSKYNTENNKK